MAKENDEPEGCLVCGNTTPKMTRGLCSAHYLQFNRSKNKIPEEKRQAFDDEMVELGLVLPAGRAGRRKRYEDPFAEHARKYESVDSVSLVAEPANDYATSIDKEAAEIVQEMKEQLENKSSRKKRKSRNK